MRDRLLQLACVAVLVLGAVANGGMLQIGRAHV